ncbi:integrase [Sporolactobacillus sp. THM7-7]|nr:integrase [Sporolactobacillus sp. THM7-7]
MSFKYKVVKRRPHRVTAETTSHSEHKNCEKWFFRMLIHFAVKDFLADKELENLSKNTVSGYEMLFKDVLRFCEERGLTRILELTTRVIKSYLSECKEKGNNSVTLNTKRRQFRAWFNWLVAEDVLEENPTDKIKKAKEDIRIYAFTDEEVKEILSYLRRMKRREDAIFSVRNYTVFLTVIGTSMRAGKMCSLRWHNVDLISRQVKVFSKMREEQSIPLDSKLCRELAYWREYCLKQFNGSLSEYVFVTCQNIPHLTVNGLKCFFKIMRARS